MNNIKFDFTQVSKFTPIEECCGAATTSSLILAHLTTSQHILFQSNLKKFMTLCKRFSFTKIQSAPYVICLATLLAIPCAYNPSKSNKHFTSAWATALLAGSAASVTGLTTMSLLNRHRALETRPFATRYAIASRVAAGTSLGMVYTFNRLLERAQAPRDTAP